MALMTTKRWAIIVAMLVAVAVGVWVTAGLTRPSGASAQRSAEPGAAASAPLHAVPPDAKVTLRFFRDPATVTPVAMRSIDGQSLSSETLRGKVVIVNFWATWCPPCRKEMPDLDALYQKYKDQGFVVLSISDEEAAKVSPFITERKISYPVLLDPRRKVNEAFVVTEAFGWVAPTSLAVPVRLTSATELICTDCTTGRT